MREEIIGGCRLINADCRDVLPTLGKVDAVVTDPPYGIGEARNDNTSRSCLAQSRDYGISSWDDEPLDAETLTKLREISRWQVVFGGNYFAVPPSSCWLVWDKKNGANDFADCELAWTNLPKAVRRLEWQWHGMIRRGNEERFHPTQKPLGVMQWCLTHLPADCRTILDPFMGVGTTGVACVKAALSFIGIEREEKYFDIACKRIEAATKEPRLPLPEPKMKQGVIL